MQRYRHTVLTAFLSVTVIFLTMVILPSAGSSQLPENGNSTQQLTQLQEIARKYEIDIATSNLGFPVKTTHGFIDGSEAASLSLRKYQKLLASEINRYPLSLVRNSRLLRIVLCEDLKFDGQRRNAIPDFEHDALYLDVKRGDYNTLYQRKVIHHEFFHIIDYKDDGSVYTDSAWAALNPPAFKYGTGGKNAQDDPSTSVLTDRFPGFLNHYSTTGVEEDKAEVFANMIAEPKHVNARSTKDPVMKAKVKAMKDLLQKFCPEVDDDFWKKGR